MTFHLRDLINDYLSVCDRALLEPKHTSKILIESQANLVSVTDASMCQTHGYMQRTDDIDNASECSDEGVYRHHHHHSHTHMRTQNANNNLVTKSINIQAAVIHVIGDFIQSIGVFTSAVIIKFFVSITFRIDAIYIDLCCFMHFAAAGKSRRSNMHLRIFNYCNYHNCQTNERLHYGYSGSCATFSQFKYVVRRVGMR